jgi:hypothetical protein
MDMREATSAGTPDLFLTPRISLSLSLSLSLR